MRTCSSPFRSFGCGQCVACLIQKRRVWTHRIVLESLMHAHNSFATLTYDEANHPADGNLNKSHLQLWMKRLRKHFAAGAIRFYAVGEYGDQTSRPHYHAALFGVSPLQADIVTASWGLGHTMLGDLTPASARYVAGYVTKKISPTSPRPSDVVPEFALMSRRPGIGGSATPTLTAMLGTKLGLEEIDRLGDVPASLKHGTAQLPLGRYLRDRLRAELGFMSQDSLLPLQWKENAQKNIAYDETAKMQALWLNYCSSPQASSKTFPVYLEEMTGQKLANLKSRERISNKEYL